MPLFVKEKYSTKVYFYLLPQGIVVFYLKPCIQEKQLHSAQMLKALFLMHGGTNIFLCDCVQIIFYAHFWHQYKHKILLENIDMIVMYISGL